MDKIVYFSKTVREAEDHWWEDCRSVEDARVLAEQVVESGEADCAWISTAFCDEEYRRLEGWSVVLWHRTTPGNAVDETRAARAAKKRKELLVLRF